jgi:competence protein ComEC
MPPAIAAAVALTAAATAGTAPLIALHFGRASLVALPANVAAAPAVAPAMWLGMVAAAVGQLWPAAARVAAALAAYPAAYLSWLAHAAARAPLAEVGASPLEATAVVAALAVAVVASRRRAAAALAGALQSSPRAAASRRRLLGLALVAAVAATAIAAGSQRGGAGAPPAGTRISVLDVGQGDATLVQHGAAAILVDAGEPGGDVVARLREAGVRRLDALVVTHAQADHAGGAAAVLEAVDVGVVLDGRDGVREPTGSAMAAAARRHGVRLVPALAGLRVRAGPLDLRVLWPQPRARGSPPVGDPNLRAVVAELRAGGVSMLLAADAESEVLAQLDLRPVDVLKVAHHGSADAGLPAVLARLRPRIATISAGAHNRFGHPAPSTLRALRAAGAAVVRTDRHGTVRVTPAGGTLHVEWHA